ncbi:MAG: IS5/IS1182 family transposase, partial [Rhodospirillales bacterium]|nr:IS5/IS1182 family transposase [Rhodospirillales bacterium]
MDPDEINALPEASFRRLTGVRKKTFFEMRDILDAEDIRRKARGGRPNRLPVHKRLLMTLEYWRE